MWPAGFLRAAAKSVGTSACKHVLTVNVSIQTGQAKTTSLSLQLVRMGLVQLEIFSVGMPQSSNMLTRPGQAEVYKVSWGST